MTDAVPLRDALEKASQDLNDILLKAQEKFQENETQFVSQNIGILCGGLEVYGVLFKQSGCEDRETLEKAITQQGTEVKKAAAKLLDVEDDWSEFLRSIEAKELSQGDYIMPSIGDSISQEIAFTRVPTKEDRASNPLSLSSPLEKENPGASKYETVNLKDILALSTQTSSTLLVLNRHFA
ncbi:uncharacterized protein [Palaemon carinicauda]|uniref:uncharacterized protein isoform X1 n=1 Tax=Palaemon carinicauda TaxID=392227 RepID=UPI0035B5C1AF